MIENIVQVFDKFMWRYEKCMNRMSCYSEKCMNRMSCYRLKVSRLFNLFYYYYNIIEDYNITKKAIKNIEIMLETSKNRYYTMLIDSQQYTAIGVQLEKDKKAVKEFSKKLENHGGECENIVSATGDMSFTFLVAVDESFQNAVHMIEQKHKQKILSCFSNTVSDTIGEGIGSMDQTVKGRARGFHTFRSFAVAIYLIVGKLKLAVPCPT